jgi:hypothetical protein
MRTREGIEPRDARSIVGADVLSPRAGDIHGAHGHGSRAPPGVGDHGTSAGPGRELGRSEARLHSGGRAGPPAHREEAPRRRGRRRPPDAHGRGGHARCAQGGPGGHGLAGHAVPTQRWRPGDDGDRVHRQTGSQGARGDGHGPEAPRPRGAPAGLRGGAGGHDSAWPRGRAPGGGWAAPGSSPPGAAPASAPDGVSPPSGTPGRPPTGGGHDAPARDQRPGRPERPGAAAPPPGGQ